MPDRELDLNAPQCTEDLHYALVDAIDLASDQNQVTWLTEDGRRIAAIVPADMAYREDEVIPQVLKALGHFRPATASEFSRLGRLDRKLAVQNRRNGEVREGSCPVCGTPLQLCGHRNPDLP